MACCTECTRISRARERELDRRRDAGPLDRHAHRRSRRAAQRLLRLFHGEPVHRLAIHFDDPIARGNSRVDRRPARQRRDDRDPAVAHVDLRTHARIPARGALRQFGEQLGRQVRAVRIVQLADQTFDGARVQGGIGERVDELAGDVPVDLVEEVRAVDRRARRSDQPALDEPPARNERAGQYHGNEHRS